MKTLGIDLGTNSLGWAVINETKGAGQSSIDFENPHELLLINLKKAWSSFLFEGIHFKMGLDGKVKFIIGAQNETRA